MGLVGPHVNCFKIRNRKKGYFSKRTKISPYNKQIDKIKKNENAVKQYRLMCHITDMKIKTLPENSMLCFAYNG